MISRLAKAKINLALHVTGQRADGYHLLDSLVVFADIGDQVDIFDANTLSLTIEGPEAAGVPSDMSNSILKAAELFKPQDRGAAFVLTKNLPVASGIGGGSSDAAAAIRGLIEHWGGTPDDLFPEGLDPSKLSHQQRQRIVDGVKRLGADLPVCLFSRSARMEGIGDTLTFLDEVPSLHAVLVNPRIPVETPTVFKALRNKSNPAMDALPDPKRFISWLARQRNDLEPPAISVFPQIADVLGAIAATTNCQVSRMSGSGATCFGLFETAGSAKSAAEKITADHPEWWTRQTELGHIL